MISNLLLSLAISFATPVAAPVQKALLAESPEESLCKNCVRCCADYQTACDIGFLTSAAEMIGGDKSYRLAMETCLGCADACKLASTLSARKCPIAAHARECCMKCCADTAATCDKFRLDHSMIECAKACRSC